jgi:hypothetical protein
MTWPRPTVVKVPALREFLDIAHFKEMRHDGFRKAVCGLATLEVEAIVVEAP